MRLLVGEQGNSVLRIASSSVLKDSGMIELCKEAMCIHCGKFFTEPECIYFGKLYCICVGCSSENPVKPKYQNLCDTGLRAPRHLDYRIIHNLPNALKKVAQEMREDWKEDNKLTILL
jgi:hypothetical protein